jgi:hypothetical protein
LKDNQPAAAATSAGPPLGQQNPAQTTYTMAAAAPAQAPITQQCLMLMMISQNHLDTHTFGHHQAARLLNKV